MNKQIVKGFSAKLTMTTLLMAFATQTNAAPLTYQTIVDYGTATSGDIAIADFNNDGVLDIAATETNNNQVTVYIGDGQGAFTLGTSSPTGISPHQVIAEDFNADGNLDLMTANYDSNNATLFLGDGSGNFNDGIQTIATGQAAAYLQAIDLNNDGKKDVVLSGDIIIGGQSAYTVMLNLGGGNFSLLPKVSFNNYVFSGSREVALADFNGDGNTDIVVSAKYDVASGSRPNVEYHSGNGDGTFTYVSGWISSTVSSPVTDIRASISVDLDTDGLQDLLLGTGSSIIQYYKGDGLGGFTYVADITGGNTNQTPYILDIDADNRPDIITIDSTSVNVILNVATNTFSAAQSFSINYAGRNVHSADINGDNKPDLIATYTSTTSTASFGVILSGVASTTPSTAIPSTSTSDTSSGGCLAPSYNNQGLWFLLFMLSMMFFGIFKSIKK